MGDRLRDAAPVILSAAKDLMAIADGMPVAAAMRSFAALRTTGRRFICQGRREKIQWRAASNEIRLIITPA
jgi:hypothetical protein